tara:strand:+ start:217 stop:420 length:204 start_codon:yes stop_codon:yes gene_type:complete
MRSGIDDFSAGGGDGLKVHVTMKTIEQVGWDHEEVMQELQARHEREEREIAQLRWEMWVEASSEEDE